MPYLRLPTGRSALRIIFIIIIGGKAIGRWLGLTYEQVRPLIDDKTIPTFKLPGHTKRCALKSILYETFAKYAQRFSYEICPANARQHPIAKMVFALWCRCEMVGLKNVPPAWKDNRCTATNRRGSSRESRHGCGQEPPGRFCVNPLFLSLFVCEAIMRLLSRMAVAIVSAWMGVHVNPAAAQSFEDRFSIIPKAHAEPSPEPGRPSEPAPQTQSPLAAEPTRGSENRSFKRSFSGKASFYSYRNGKTASGSLFDRNLPTAAHRSLPFGTRVRVIDLANNKSVIITITDRGPKAPGRVLDLSLNAARTLGITDRGVVQVRAQVL